MSICKQWRKSKSKRARTEYFRLFKKKNHIHEICVFKPFKKNKS